MPSAYYNYEVSPITVVYKVQENSIIHFWVQVIQKKKNFKIFLKNKFYRRLGAITNKLIKQNQRNFIEKLLITAAFFVFEFFFFKFLLRIRQSQLISKNFIFNRFVLSSEEFSQ